MAKQRASKGASGVGDWISGVANTIGVDRVGNVIGGAIDGAAWTKATVDRNIEGLMSLASLPTKRDYHRLLTKIDSLQGNLVNVSKKLDRLTADMASLNGHKASPKTTRSRTKAAKATKSSKSKSTSRRRKSR